MAYLLERLAVQQLQNSTTQPHDPINVTALITRLNETIVALLLERIADLERNINDINMMQITFNSTLTNTNDRLNSMSSQLRNTSSELSSRLNTNSASLTSLRSSLIRTNLFNRCVKEENSCFVNQHTPQWYLCTTPARIINRSVSEVAMICSYVGKWIFPVLLKCILTFGLKADTEPSYVATEPFGQKIGVNQFFCFC